MAPDEGIGPFVISPSSPKVLRGIKDPSAGGKRFASYDTLEVDNFPAPGAL
jgi:hypothetical protein